MNATTPSRIWYLRRSRLIPAGIALLATCCGSATTQSPSGSPGDSHREALVQVENNSAARPQWGLQHAALVYEYVTEGGISRFSAFYTDSSASRIGPVRSARLVTVHLAQIYGAVIVYSGASAAVQQAIELSGAPHIDEAASHGDLYRIGDRPVPHNLVTDGSHLAHLLDGAPRTDLAATGAGHPASRFTVPISPSETPAFMYDALAGGWRRSEPDTGDAVDATSGRPLVAATVVVQQVRIVDAGNVEDANGAHGVDHILTGTGAAQVFTAGKEYDATWTQPQLGVPAFTLANGSRAPIAAGLVWICLVPTGSPASTT